MKSISWISAQWFSSCLLFYCLIHHIFLLFISFFLFSFITSSLHTSSSCHPSLQLILLVLLSFFKWFTSPSLHAGPPPPPLLELSFFKSPYLPPFSSSSHLCPPKLLKHHVAISSSLPDNPVLSFSARPSSSSSSLLRLFLYLIFFTSASMSFLTYLFKANNLQHCHEDICRLPLSFLFFCCRLPVKSFHTISYQLSHISSFHLHLPSIYHISPSIFLSSLATSPPAANIYFVKYNMTDLDLIYTWH